jgi:mitochondrial fission protein ELM1
MTLEPGDQGLIWVLHTTGLGANHQLRALARSTGARFEIKHCLDKPQVVFMERLARFPARSIATRKNRILQPPWPDLVLFGGGRSVVDAWRIRHASQGHSRLVCVGRPAAALDAFDLILTTPQYRLPRHPRVRHLPLPYHDPSHVTRQPAGAVDAIAGLSSPWVGVLLGGDSGSYRWTERAANALARELEDLARRRRVSLALSTSPRTPSLLQDAISKRLDGQHYLYRWRADDKANPLGAILAGAAAFVVTADSASMLAEACATGRPVASYSPPLRPLAGLLRRRWLPGRRWRERATAAGWWVPARDMHRIHTELVGKGRIVDIGDLDPGGPDVDAVLPEWHAAALDLGRLLSEAVEERKAHGQPG